MLGAIGEQMGWNPAALRRFRNSLNPLSRFDFGLLAGLPSLALAGQGTSADMRLFEHPDFEQLILRAARTFSRARASPGNHRERLLRHGGLRIVAAGRRKVIFKGGTSLAKGWNLIQRFSEDIDIFLDPRLHPALGKNAIDRELKTLRDAVAGASGADVSSEGKPDHRRLRTQRRFSYHNASAAGEVVNRVLVESGTASGRNRSGRRTAIYLGQFLSETGISLDAEDEGAVSDAAAPFPPDIRRENVCDPQQGGNAEADWSAPRRLCGHYYDLFQLSDQEAVIAMLKSEEYAAIKADYDQISRSNFPDSYFYPDEMSFARSDALFPPSDLSNTIGREYEAQCRQLCYGPFPSWADITARFSELRKLL